MTTITADELFAPQPIRTQRGARLAESLEFDKTWAPAPLTVILDAAVAGLCFWGAGIAVAAGGGWVILGVYLYLNGGVAVIVALKNLFRFV